jgi:hypothetical protein
VPSSLWLRIPQTRWTWPVNFTFNWWFANGKPGGGCHHGPKSESWPWWKIITFTWLDLVKGNAYAYKDRPIQHSSRRLWVYTRCGAVHLDITVDRRFYLNYVSVPVK